MKVKFYTITAFLFAFFQMANSQVSLTLQPDGTAGKDALLHSNSPDVNYGTSTQFCAAAFTSSSQNFITRELIDFDLTSIPAAAKIETAFLSLYSFYAKDYTGSMGQHYGIMETGQDNSCFLQRVTSSWDESTVTWNNQPKSETANQIALPATTSVDQNFENIDVKTLVQDMISNKSTSFGFMVRLQTETIYRRVNFCSSDFADATRRPKLVVSYTMPTKLDKVNISSDQKIFPNPSNGVFQVTLTKADNSVITVYNVNGKLMKTVNSEKKSLVNIDLTGLAKGLYLIKIKTNSKVSTEKVTIQ